MNKKCKHQHFVIRSYIEYYLKEGYEAFKNKELNKDLSEYEIGSGIIVQCIDCGSIIDEKI